MNCWFSLQSSNLSHPHNLLQKVVICVLLNTGFKGMQVVTHPTNYQTTKVMQINVPKKGLGTYTWINKVHSSSRICSCSMRGMDIAGVEGQWLNNGPNHSVPETQMTAPGSSSLFLIYFPPQIAQEITVTSFYDVMIICSTLLAGNPLCMCRGNAIIHLQICWHHQWNHELLSLQPNHIIFSLSWILCLWHIYVYIYTKCKTWWLAYLHRNRDFCFCTLIFTLCRLDSGFSLIFSLVLSNMIFVSLLLLNIKF